jgi:hypothetical protein
MVERVLLFASVSFTTAFRLSHGTDVEARDMIILKWVELDRIRLYSVDYMVFVLAMLNHAFHNQLQRVNCLGIGFGMMEDKIVI